MVNQKPNVTESNPISGSLSSKPNQLNKMVNFDEVNRRLTNVVYSKKPHLVVEHKQISPLITNQQPKTVKSPEINLNKQESPVQQQSLDETEMKTNEDDQADDLNITLTGIIENIVSFFFFFLFLEINNYFFLSLQNILGADAPRID